MIAIKYFKNRNEARAERSSSKEQCLSTSSRVRESTIRRTFFTLPTMDLDCSLSHSLRRQSKHEKVSNNKKGEENEVSPLDASERTRTATKWFKKRNERSSCKSQTQHCLSTSSRNRELTSRQNFFSGVMTELDRSVKTMRRGSVAKKRDDLRSAPSTFVPRTGNTMCVADC